MKSTFKAPDRQLVTLRLQVPRDLRVSDDWAAICKQPNDIALGPVHGFGAWQKLQAGAQQRRETVLECYCKVAANDKDKVLARSGAEGIFVAELAKDGAKPVVAWIPAGETVGPAYLREKHRRPKPRFRRGGGASLRAGARCLGFGGPNSKVMEASRP